MLHQGTMRTPPSAAFAIISAVAMAGGCGDSTSSYPPLTERLVAAVNYLYNVESRSVPPVRFSIASATVPSAQVAAAKTAAEAAIRDCNEGSGTWIIAVGLVDSTIARQPIFAVFMNPPGNHIAPSAEALVPGAPRLNWYAAFMTSLSQPFCTFGHSPNLSPLPIH